MILNVVCSGHPKGGSGTARCIACGEVVGNVVPKVLSTPEVREKVFKFEQQQQRVTRKEVEAELMDGPHAIPSVIRIDNVPWVSRSMVLESQKEKVYLKPPVCSSRHMRLLKTSFLRILSTLSAFNQSTY